jgi:hypothetical protein
VSWPCLSRVNRPLRTARLSAESVQPTARAWAGVNTGNSGSGRTVPGQPIRADQVRHSREVWTVPDPVDDQVFAWNGRFAASRPTI